MTHPAIAPGRAAVIVGGASGIGLACARAFAARGLKICLADLEGDALDAAADGLRAAGAEVHAVPVDVARAADLERLRDAAYARFGDVAVLMNNAGIGTGAGAWEHPDRWRRLMDVNLFGVVNGVQAFAPALLAQGTPAAIINTGSKQGITNPPGNLAYNVSKAGVKALTEGLAHELRNVEGGQVSAHLLIPGFTFTGMTRRGGAGEKPPGAWTADQVAEFMIAALGEGRFYILCPDNDVTREMDERRIQWAADDLILDRPALSRWDPRFKAAFEEFISRPPSRE